MSTKSLFPLCLWPMCISMVAVTALVRTAPAQEAPAQRAVILLAEANRALDDGDYKLAVSKTDEMLKVDAKSPRLQLGAGDIYLRSGKPQLALKHFDAFLKSTPRALPRLWQRGIAQFFAGDFKGGVKQFEVHREVNPNDVENAAWHFLCVAKADSFDQAAKMVLPAPGDPRLPMEEVLKMLSNGDTQAVVDRIEAQKKGSRDRVEAEFYGYFYLGLYADAKGNRGEALKWMKKSAEAAPGGYMGDVARVYAQHLEDAKTVNK